MPHVLLEYTDNLKEKINFSDLFDDLHQILVVVASADLESCKSRAIEYDNFYIGNGNARNAFVHVRVLLAEGRSLAIRQEIGKQFLNVLEECYSHSLKELQLEITVQIEEFSKNIYFKSSRDY